MPLVALILGTAAIGSEIDDGTAVYLMIKPIPRWRIALAKIARRGRSDGRRSSCRRSSSPGCCWAARAATRRPRRPLRGRPASSGGTAYAPRSWR